jgi:hypothetical protein
MSNIVSDSSEPNFATTLKISYPQTLELLAFFFSPPSEADTLSLSNSSNAKHINSNRNQMQSTSDPIISLGMLHAEAAIMA